MQLHHLLTLYYIIRHCMISGPGGADVQMAVAQEMEQIVLCSYKGIAFQSPVSAIYAYRGPTP